MQDTSTCKLILKSFRSVALPLPPWPLFGNDLGLFFVNFDWITYTYCNCSQHAMFTIYVFYSQLSIQKGYVWRGIITIPRPPEFYHASRFWNHCISHCICVYTLVHGLRRWINLCLPLPRKRIKSFRVKRVTLKELSNDGTLESSGFYKSIYKKINYSYTGTGLCKSTWKISSLKVFTLQF